MTTQDKLTGIRAVCSDSKTLASDEFLHVIFDPREGRVWGDRHERGDECWHAYGDEELVPCGVITEPMSQRDIVELVEFWSEEKARAKAYYAALCV